MRCPARIRLVALLLIAAARPSGATIVMVPDDVPGIQAAIDRLPDTVLVRSGVYRERPVVTRDLVLLGVGTKPPQLDGFRIYLPDEQFQIVVDGFHFKGLTRLDTGDEVTEYVAFRRCVFDSGFVQTFSDVADVSEMEFRECRISGPCAPYATHLFTFSSNVVDGPVQIRGDYLYYLDVRDNVIRRNNVSLADQAPASGSWGLWISSDQVEGQIRGNRIEGFFGGLTVPYGERVEISDNVILDCPGIGMSVDSRNATLVGNVILRCGTGMSLRNERYELIRNVIGRSARQGVIAQLEWLRLKGNTLYLNGGPGIEFWGCGCWGGPVVEMDRNIFYRNGAFGASYVPANAILSSNDWLGNASGAVHPGGPGATDLAVEPLFCGVLEDDVHLQANSPLADVPGWGLVGALGVGCAPVASAPLLPAAGGFELDAVWPQPSTAEVQLRFHLPYAATIELDVLDIQGRVMVRLAEGPHQAGVYSVRWSGESASHAASPGVYFVRFRHPEGEQSRAVLRLR